VIDCCTREIVGWDLSLRCRTEEALAALNRAVLEVLPFGSRGMGLTLTTDNGTQFTSAGYVETLNRLGITHRRTAYNHPEGNSYLERRRGVAQRVPELRPGRTEHRSLDRGVQSRRPHRGLHGRTPHDARARFALTLTSNMAPRV
jgi:putative transposase